MASIICRRVQEAPHRQPLRLSLNGVTEILQHALGRSGRLQARLGSCVAEPGLRPSISVVCQFGRVLENGYQLIVVDTPIGLAALCRP